MQWELHSPAKKVAACGALLALAAGYLGLTTRHVLAAHDARFDDEPHLRHAVMLDPGSAEYADQLGRHELLAAQSPSRAVAWLTTATTLNPHAAHYWMDLAIAQQSLGDTHAETRSLDHALAADPRNAVVAWNAANLYLAQGNPDRTMKLLRSVLENDPALTNTALNTCWRVRPDAEYLLAEVVPPAAYDSFLEFLIAKKETAPAARVWDKIFAFQQPVERRYLLDYERYLISNHEVAQASRVWQQATNLSGLAPYQPSVENLVINGDFSLPILNGGLEWMHRDIAGVELALDTNEPHSSARSLRITLDGVTISDAGIMQLVPVEPHTTYEFSGSYKAEDMDGVGGMEFSIADAYKNASLFMSEDLRDADFWKRVSGTFTTGPDTNLIALQIARVPPGIPIRGKLWIDGLRLVKAGKDSVAPEDAP